MSEMMHIIQSTDHVYSFSAENEPAAQASPGDVVTFHTEDAFGGQLRSEADTLDEVNFDFINPATGPLFVSGAQPGDVLAVNFLHMETGSRGVVLSVPGSGVMGDEVPSSTTKIVEIRDRWIEFQPGLRLPKKPMMGVVGVAPAEKSIPSGTPGRHGGNMDTKEVTAGATLYLPVRAPGALLAMGDAHALQGDGEICGTAVECSACATVRVDVRRGCDLQWPWLSNQDRLMVIVSAETTDEAYEEATRQMVRYLVDARGMDFNDAYMLMSCVGSLNISQVVDPLLTVRAEIPHRYL